MATIQLGTTKVANKLISYCEKRATERDGINCPAQYAKSQFTATRELWGKTEGIQAHHVIQSFKPGEVTAQQANEIGLELAKQIAERHEAVVYTHTDKGHIHNHIVINAVSYEDGKKYRAHGKDAIEKVRDISDRICHEKGLSVVSEKTAEVRYTLTEKALIEKDKFSWKDDIRDKINDVKQTAASFEDFKKNLLEKHNIECIERGKHTTYINHDNEKRVRGNKLGEAYEKETIKYEYQRNAERGASKESESKLGFNEHVFKAIGSNRGEDERSSNGTIQRNEKVYTDRDRTREGTEGSERTLPATERTTQGTSQSHDELKSRGHQASAGADSHRRNDASKDKQGSSRANITNNSTSERPDNVRGGLKAETKAKLEGTLNGDRIANSGDRSADISGMGNTNATPSVSGNEMLSDVLKAVEQVAKEIEAEQKAIQAKQQRQIERQQGKSQEYER